MEFDRHSAETIDYQRIKLTECDYFSENINNDESDNRIPRTLDIELRHSLVDTCITGDIVTIVGIVKTMQVGLND